MRTLTCAALAAAILIPSPSASAAPVVVVANATTAGGSFECSAVAAGGPVVNTWVTCRWLDADGATILGFNRSTLGPASAATGTSPAAGVLLCVEARATGLDGSRTEASTCAETPLPGGGWTGTATSG